MKLNKKIEIKGLLKKGGSKNSNFQDASFQDASFEGAGFENEPSFENEASEKKSFLKKDIFSSDIFKNLPFVKKGAGAKARLPHKRTMNLAVSPNAENNPRKVVPAAVILAVIVILFCKFAVIDRLTALSEAMDQYEQSRASLAEIQVALEDYDDVREKYIRYTENYKDETEYSIVERTVVFNLLKEATGGLATINTVSMVDNEVSLEVLTASLDNVAKIKTNLDTSPLVKKVSVYMADTNMIDEEDAGKLNASILISIEDPNRPAPVPETEDSESTDSDSTEE